MELRRGRRLLLIAVVCSIVIHLLAIHFFRWPLAIPTEPPQSVTLSKQTLLPITHHSPTPAPPKPRPSAPKQTLPNKVAPPRTVAALHGRRALPVSGPPANSAPTFTPAPLPTPTVQPTSKPTALGCSRPDADAAVAVSATPPPISPEVRGSDKSGTAQIQVMLDARGAVVQTVVAQSSGDSGLDRIADAMARASSFTPRLIACKPVAAIYAFTVKFVAL
ncbi:MAG: TonB family protein [Candidatus Eremiobacteraeota bacterium]|nr:TonB family protein [Candidatus Eremiobacteraeota bacterium]